MDEVDAQVVLSSHADRDEYTSDDVVWCEVHIPKDVWMKLIENMHIIERQGE